MSTASVQNPPPQSSTIVAQFVAAPQRPVLRYRTRLFLAGTTPAKSSTSIVDWRQLVKDAVADLPVTVLDPVRPDWGPDWVEDPDVCAPFREQVEWELAMQADEATIVAFYFDPAKAGTVSLLELGLCLGRLSGSSASVAQKAIVGCPPGYATRGNVRMVCERYGVAIVGSAGALAGAVRNAVKRSIQEALAGT